MKVFIKKLRKSSTALNDITSNSWSIKPKVKPKVCGCMAQNHSISISFCCSQINHTFQYWKYVFQIFFKVFCWQFWLQAETRKSFPMWCSLGEIFNSLLNSFRIFWHGWVLVAFKGMQHIKQCGCVYVAVLGWYYIWERWIYLYTLVLYYRAIWVYSLYPPK